MRVLLISPEYPPALGGGASYAHQLAKVLCGPDTEVAVITGGKIDSESTARKIKAFRFKSYRQSLDTYSLSAKMIDDTLDVIKRWRPDVVHAHHSASILTCLAISNHFPLPLVFTQHRTPEYPVSEVRHDGKASLADSFYKNSMWALWIAPSNFFAHRLRAGGVSSGQIHVIYPSVDQHHFKPLSRGQINANAYLSSIPQGYLLIPAVDRPRKDIEFILRSMHGQSLPPVLITGIEMNSERHQVLTEKYPHLNFIAHDKIPTAYMPALYQGALMTVLSSTHEGLGISGLEAIACGSHLLLRDSPGLREIAKVHSFVRSFKNEDELQQLINESPRIDLGSKGLDPIFTPNEQKRCHLEVYNKAMENEFSAGGFCLCFSGGDVYVRLIVSKKGMVNVPKGHVKAGETWEDAARREIREETGIIPNEAAFYTGESTYTFEQEGRHVTKTVRYYTFIQDKIEDGAGLALEPSENIASSHWLKYENALGQLEHESDKAMLKKARDIFDAERASEIY